MAKKETAPQTVDAAVEAAAQPPLEIPDPWADQVASSSPEVDNAAPPAVATVRLDSPPPEKAPDFIVATFDGTYYASTAVGLAKAHFEVDVRIPVSFVLNPDMSPISIFRKFYAKRIMPKAVKNFQSVHRVKLVSTSELPNGLTHDQLLAWTADYKDLQKMTRGTGIDTSLYANAGELRRAIRRQRAEPEAFAKEQEKRAKSGVRRERGYEDELAALGY